MHTLHFYCFSGPSLVKYNLSLSDKDRRQMLAELPSFMRKEIENIKKGSLFGMEISPLHCQQRVGYYLLPSI